MHSSNKSRTMSDLINKELGKDRHNIKNTQLVKNDLAYTLDKYYTNVIKNIFKNKLPIASFDKANLSSNQCISMFLASAPES